jgi:hypothetical protein
MGTQNQTPGSRTQQQGQGGSKQNQQNQKGQDAGNVARTDDDLLDEASSEGTREDATGTKSRSSTSDRNEKS